MTADPHEQTATAPQTSTKPVIAAGARFDHYVIERELGSGGMGVVYAALDTELQRRVALKLIREGLADEAQQRLLREARAMARLQHPNVVTVFEVGTAEGRDFIAMELVEGEPLAEWIRATPRTQHEILDAFVAAGRGLAAAHAAGIVHRDFKPHNVLRSTSGRIAVTDFGLARDATDPLAVTAPPTATGALTDSNLTVPGAVLGTPAYMAPEQWSGGRLTPATDQFAFCVALWEALAGERPYRGATLDALREQVTRGPDELDDRKLPRALRRVLRRGLAADPAARWPSMDALIAHLVPRRRFALVAAAGAALVAGAIVAVMMTRTSEPTCRAPAFAMPAGEAWRAQREAACAAPAAVRDRQLDCLDGVLARLDAIERAKKLVADHDFRGLVLDPKICTRDAPALPARYSDDAVVALAIRSGAKLAAPKSPDPCVAAYIAMGEQRDRDAEPLARQCGDDSALAVLALRAYERDIAGLAADAIAPRVQEVQRMLASVGFEDFSWTIDNLAGFAYAKHDRHREAVASFEAAMRAAPPDQRPVLVARQAVTLLDRARPTDLATLREKIASIRAAATGEVADELDALDATARWYQGDLLAAGNKLRALHEKHPIKLPQSGRVTGVVVDTYGKPLTAARVVVGIVMLGDPHSIATPIWDETGVMRAFVTVNTDANGAFALDGVPTCHGTIAAQHGSQRSRPQPITNTMRIVVEPTVRIAGRVDLGGRTGTFVVGVTMRSNLGSVSVMAPTASDGRFELAGVLPGQMSIGVSEARGIAQSLGMMQPLHVDAKKPPTDLALELPAGRKLLVLVRGAQNGGIAFAFKGTRNDLHAVDMMDAMTDGHIATTYIRPVIGEPPDEVASLYREGDLLATFASAPIGPATACLFAEVPSCGEMPKLRCVAVPPNAAVVVAQ